MEKFTPGITLHLMMNDARSSKGNSFLVCKALGFSSQSHHIKSQLQSFTEEKLASPGKAADPQVICL
jgi:hypothetical protein